MSTEYKSAFEYMQTTLARNPRAAVARFRASTQQVEGLQSKATIRQFGLTVDEPPALAGTDAGPNPVELILAALGACQEITFRLYAAKMGIPLNSVSVNVEGDLDLRGFFAVDQQARPGFTRIRASVNIDSPASAEELDMLIEAVEKHCPVLDILSNATPVDVAFQRSEAIESQRAVA